MKGIIINILLWLLFVIIVIIVDISNQIALFSGIIILNIWSSKLYDNKKE